MAVLREEKNITYGASAGVSHFGRGSMLNAGGSVQTDATVEAVTTMVDELVALAGNDIESDRFARTVGNLVRTGPISYTSAGAVAGALARLVSEGLPDDYYDRVRRDMATTTAEQAAAAFGRYVDIDRLRIVAVGDASRFVDGLAGLGWGEVTVEPRL
jgi:zinc protease